MVTLEKGELTPSIESNKELQEGARVKILDGRAGTLVTINESRVHADVKLDTDPDGHPYYVALLKDLEEVKE